MTISLCSGRAGREAPGKCFRLYPEGEFEKLDDSTKPEIKRCNLSNVILQLKALGVDDVIGFDFIEKPSRYFSVHRICFNASFYFEFLLPCALRWMFLGQNFNMKSAWISKQDSYCEIFGAVVFAGGFDR